MESKAIQFTREEAQASIQLYDLAVKSWWLQVAEAALVLTKKIQEQFKEDLVEKEWEKEDKKK